MLSRIVSLTCVALAFSASVLAANEGQPGPSLCSKWLTGSPIYETLISELDFNHGLELDVSPLPSSKEHQNSVGALISERMSQSLIEKQMRAMAEAILRNPNAPALATFKETGFLFGYTQKLAPAEEHVIMATKQRLERVINFGLRTVYGFAELSIKDEQAYFRLLIDESSAFLASIARPHRVVSRAPKAKEVQVEDFYIELRDLKGAVVGKYDPIESFKQLFELRNMILADRPQPKPQNSAKSQELRIKEINQKLEASRQRVMRQIKSEGENATGMDKMLQSLQFYKAEALRVTVERLPEAKPYSLGGQTIQPGHYVLRFHDSATGKTELRPVSVEALKAN